MSSPELERLKYLYLGKKFRPVTGNRHIIGLHHAAFNLYNSDCINGIRRDEYVVSDFCKLISFNDGCWCASVGTWTEFSRSMIDRFGSQSVILYLGSIVNSTGFLRSICNYSAQSH